MNNHIDIDTEKIVIDMKSNESKYTHEEKIKYLQDAIQNGGYYGTDGTWNSIKVFQNDNHIYRVRVETLIIKDDKYIFLKFLPKTNIGNDKRGYLVPGGSTAKDTPNIDQAINECKEEARILVRNIQSSGITYKEQTKPPKWAIVSQAVNWNGNYTEVYVAEYDQKYTGHIEKTDEDRFMATGKFYEITKVYTRLRKEHKDALEVIYPNRFKPSKIETESSKIDRAKILDKAIKILIDAGYNPKISTASRNAFLNNKKHIVSDGSTICISGFKDKDLYRATTLVNKELKADGVVCSPDNYGTMFLSVGSDIMTEKAMTAEERNALEPDKFGIPSLRKFPIHDRKHIILAIRYFNTVDRKHEKELARNIIKSMIEFEIDFSIVGERNRLKTYIDKYDE